MIAKIVMLYLTVYNCDTGAVLYQSTRQISDFSVSGNRVEDCRQEGVSQAKALTNLLSGGVSPCLDQGGLQMGAWATVVAAYVMPQIDRDRLAPHTNGRAASGIPSNCQVPQGCRFRFQMPEARVKSGYVRVRALEPLMRHP